jgi:hypothetical protein
MKPEKQRIAIAEACGIVGPFDNRWIKEYEEEGGDSYGFTGFKKGELVFIPDYLNDLNAMHEAEKVLTKNKSMEYAFRLADSWILNGEDKQPDLVRGFCATAAERAEAFLKTIGKWEDEA